MKFRFVSSVGLRNVLIIYSSRFIEFMIIGGLGWYLPILFSNIYGAELVGLIYSVAWIPGIFVFIAGFLADLVGCKRFAAALPIATLLLLLIFYFNVNLLLLVLVVAMLKILGSFTSPALTSLLLGSVDKKHLGKFFSISRIVIEVPLTISSFVASIMVEFWGFKLLVYVLYYASIN